MSEAPKTDSNFIAELETMDLSALRDKLFLVAVSTGDRNKSKYLSTTAHGPYDFAEMCEEVGIMWREQQHHAKVVVLEKDRNKMITTLDENTVDYIECHYADLVAEAMLDGVFDSNKEFTCAAGLVKATDEDRPAEVEEPQQHATV
jgi:hypothetical protein